MTETPQEMAARADRVMAKCRQRQHVKLADLENLKNMVHHLAAEIEDERHVAREFSMLLQALAVLYARQCGGYIARDGDLDDDGAGFDILWLTVPGADGPTDVGFHLDDSAGLDDIPSRRGERRVVPDSDRMLEILKGARPVRDASSGEADPMPSYNRGRTRIPRTDQLSAEQAAHSCPNCLGIDPDTCMFNGAGS